MGTLDDAIREHLELKRQRGATDSELQRLEDEAFGLPSRPGEPDFPEQDVGSAEQSENGAVADARHEPDEDDSAEAETTIYEPDEPAATAEPEVSELELELDEESALPEEPAEDTASEPPVESLDTVEHELPEQEPEPGEQEPDSAAAGEGPPQEGEAGKQEDMLADTPEFLRDAPEDDELWFEQGKPKDFDF
ncbi:MAG TPA: hypothetical protein VN458_09980 [Solirubrobacterales bacterium]|nr:hypothetical protein [Solirubrobacterales bacterium]